MADGATEPGPAKNLIWITGASAGIGEALTSSVPWPDSRVIGISRGPAQGIEHLPADLARPESWREVGDALRRELAGFGGDRVVLIHSAGTLDPIGFAGDVDPAEYLTSIMLNCVAGQVIGANFVEATAGLAASRSLVMISSGAAHKVYPGWSAYGASKAALDQWVRIVGAEQEIRGGVRVFGIAPGVVDTGMQTQLRSTDEHQFPTRQRFIDLHSDGLLAPAGEVATMIWELVDDGVENGSIVDLREVAAGRRAGH